jgi:hypothetical protein
MRAKISRMEKLIALTSWQFWLSRRPMPLRLPGDEGLISQRGLLELDQGGARATVTACIILHCRRCLDRQATLALPDQAKPERRLME